MKTQVRALLVMAGMVCTTAAVAQRYDDDDNNYRPNNRPRMDEREREMRTDRRDNDAEARINSRRELRSRQQDDSRYDRYDNDYRDRNPSKRYDSQDLSKAYDEGFDDGLKSSEKKTGQERRENYKNFTFGLYAGGNSSRFQGEALDANGNAKGLAGRLGYQLGFFVRGGGRLYGQIGAEYLASSSEFYQAGDGKVTGTKSIIDNVDQQYLHVPAYVGIKLAQSERGVSAIRLQVGAEFATPLAGKNSVLNLQRTDFNDATLNGLANIGFDAGPLFIDFVYHHGFQNVLKESTSNSQRRILGVNVGVKF